VSGRRQDILVVVGLHSATQLLAAWNWTFEEVVAEFGWSLKTYHAALHEGGLQVVAHEQLLLAEEVAPVRPMVEVVRPLVLLVQKLVRMGSERKN